jgi:hypothetical protein
MHEVNVEPELAQRLVITAAAYHVEPTEFITSLLTTVVNEGIVHDEYLAAIFGEPLPNLSIAELQRRSRNLNA